MEDALLFVGAFVAVVTVVLLVLGIALRRPFLVPSVVRRYGTTRESVERGWKLDEARAQAVEIGLDEINESVDMDDSAFVRERMRRRLYGVEELLGRVFDKGVEWAKENQ